MGLDDLELQASDDDLIRAALDSGHPFLNGITLERLDREHFLRLNIPEPFLPFAGGAATPSGRFNLAAPELSYTPPGESRLGDETTVSKYPLELVSSKNDDAMNSTFGYRQENRRASTSAFLHAEDAATRGISTGDRVRVFNARGHCFARAEVNGAVRPGVVRIPSVGWPKFAESRQGVNVLTSQRLTDSGGGPTFYSCLVEVEKCGD